MYKKIIAGIVLTILAISITAGIVVAKRPIPEQALFRFSLSGNLALINPDPLEKGASVRYFEPDDVYDRGGRLRENCVWEVYNIGYGYLDNWESPYYGGERVELLAVGHHRYDYGETDYWAVSFEWEHEGETYYMTVRSSSDSTPEGVFDETKNKWTVQIDENNIEFVRIRKITCWLEQKGKSGKYEEICRPLIVEENRNLGATTIEVEKLQ